MRKKKFPAAPALCTVLLLAGIAWSQLNWPNGDNYTPIPGPTGGNPAGDFDYRTGTDTEDGVTRPMVEIRFVPKKGGVTCSPTAVVQTYSQSFINNDGTNEPLAKPSDMYPGNDEESARKRKKAQEAEDPNTVNGVTVDAGWSDKDPYYNGDDTADQPDAQGTQTTPTSIMDGPLLGSAWFTGKRKTLVRNFEACAYCMNKDGTLGTLLGCVTWQYTQDKDAQGKITPPSASSTGASKGHKDAAAKFVERHTRKVAGKIVPWCPEWEQEQLNLAEDLNRQAQKTEDKAKQEELRKQMKDILDKLRKERGQ